MSFLLKFFNDEHGFLTYLRRKLPVPYPTSGGGGFSTADNGLTANTATNVQLGGTLLQNTTIDAQLNTLYITGSSDLSDGIFKVDNLSGAPAAPAILGNATSLGVGVQGNTVDLYGIFGYASGTGIGGNFQSDNGIGLQCSGPMGALVQAFSGTNNASLNVMVVASSVLNSQAGFGGNIAFQSTAGNGSGVITSTISSVFTNSTFASYSSNLLLTAVDNAATKTILTLKGTGVANITQSVGNFANNAAAITGGLVAGDIYRNGDVLMIVH